MPHNILQAALKGSTKAVLLLNDVYVPIAGRGDLTEFDVQTILRLLSWTDVDSTGQIKFNDKLLHFHHAESHILILVRNMDGVNSSTSEQASVPLSPVSESVDTIKGNVDTIAADE